MGRSGGFNLGATYSSHRPQQQPQHTSSVSGSLSYTSQDYPQFSYLICIILILHLVVGPHLFQLLSLIINSYLNRLVGYRVLA